MEISRLSCQNSHHKERERQEAVFPLKVSEPLPPAQNWSIQPSLRETILERGHNVWLVWANVTMLFLITVLPFGFLKLHEFPQNSQLSCFLFFTYCNLSFIFYFTSMVLLSLDGSLKAVISDVCGCNLHPKPKPEAVRTFTSHGYVWTVCFSV